MVIETILRYRETDTEKHKKSPHLFWFLGHNVISKHALHRSLHHCFSKAPCPLVHTITQKTGCFFLMSTLENNLYQFFLLWKNCFKLLIKKLSLKQWIQQKGWRKQLNLSVSKNEWREKQNKVFVPSEDPSEISNKYVRASEPPLSWGGSAGKLIN